MEGRLIDSPIIKGDMMNDENLWLLNFVANISQIIDLGLNLGQTSNDKIMEEIQRQNTEYLEKILENQGTIIKLLKKMEH